MSTEYEHIKQYSKNPFTLECEVCQQVYPALSVRSHLRTKKHQKNSIEFTKQIMLKESAHKSIYQSNFKADSSWVIFKGGGRVSITLFSSLVKSGNISCPPPPMGGNGASN